MNTDAFVHIALQDLRIGLYVDLDVGWLSHPFASNRFKISDQRQIETLKGLGVQTIRCVPAKSDPAPVPAQPAATPAPPAVAAAPMAHQDVVAGLQRLDPRVAQRAVQQEALDNCQRRCGEVAQHYRQAMGLLPSQPLAAATLCQQVVQGMATDMLGDGEAAIRLLTESAGDKVANHPVNVAVMAMLLGRAMGLSESSLLDLGTAALLHDMGKTMLPERVHRMDDNFSSVETKAYQEHVAQGVQMARTMGLSHGVIQAIAQHHERVDGTGFPLRLRHESLSPEACILGLVNRYDGLCNPARPSMAMTPHEALASIFSQQKTRFDSAALTAFIRMVGVYPPGSVVQLNDERHAMVVAVNAARPLKPFVIVHEPRVPRNEALILDLQSMPNASIRRSLKPASLPTAALEYLQPRQRLCYFFDVAANAEKLVIGA